jgi:hypothetical protein
MFSLGRHLFSRAPPAMLARHAVLLIAQAADPRLSSATPLESTLTKVFILNNLNPLGMNALRSRSHSAQFWCNVSPFKINTCKSVSKQRTLTSFKINTYEKQAGWGGMINQLDSGFNLSSLVSSIPFVFKFLRTLLRNGATLTPFFSFRYALFLSQRGVYPPVLYRQINPTDSPGIAPRPTAHFRLSTVCASSTIPALQYRRRHEL